MKLTGRQQVILRCYQAGLHVGLPLGILIGLPWMLAREKRRRTVFRRLGFQRIGLEPNRPGSLWVHALSLGETLSSVTLVRELRRRVTDRSLVFSVSTLAAHTIARERLGDVVDCLVYFPFDLAPSVRRAVQGINPAMVVVVETDIWPGIQRALLRRGIPEVLVNARLSPQSFDSCRRFPSLFGPAYNAFEKVFPQSEREAARYREVGLAATKLGAAGNLKFDAAAIDSSDEARQQLWAELGLSSSDRVWLAGSTHPGEEKTVLEVFRRIRMASPQLRLILVPRHPHRGSEVQALCEGNGLAARRWSEGVSETEREVLVIDVMGKLASLYPVADVAFVGGSLVKKGGQNPIEPAAAGKPVLFGPDMSDFPDVARELLSRRAAFEVRDERQLQERVKQLLTEPKLGVRMGEAGRSFVRQHRGTTQRVADWIHQRITPA
jgi:3-deoxy-D-manno-octulosonic-acid transferase